MKVLVSQKSAFIMASTLLPFFSSEAPILLSVFLGQAPEGMLAVDTAVPA